MLNSGFGGMLDARCGMLDAGFGGMWDAGCRSRVLAGCEMLDTGCGLQPGCCIYPLPYIPKINFNIKIKKCVTGKSLVIRGNKDRHLIQNSYNSFKFC